MSSGAGAGPPAAHSLSEPRHSALGLMKHEQDAAELAHASLNQVPVKHLRPVPLPSHTLAP